ncbi:hypothetical protein BD410DRAFT_839215 [Rickenella mellea]|uniref:Hydrophobin n=1 Tax=Rickenella mellea TaxID=50990 RepID=A0A4Y7Q8Z8_9AGAM|nr:hypothetical protein BD410DRAFT_839215 [Rickenella mellea]
MRFNQILTVSFIYLAASAFAQQCNQGGGFFLCSDAQTACNTVTANPVTLGNGQTAKQIGGFGTAEGWLTRAKSSKTNGNLNALCSQIVAGCCAGVTTAQKSTIPLESGEQGSVQIITS